MITAIAWYNPNGIIFLLPNSVAFISQKEKNVWFSFVNLQRAKNGTHMFGVKYRYVSVVLISSNRTLGIKPH